MSNSGLHLHFPTSTRTGRRRRPTEESEPRRGPRAAAGPREIRTERPQGRKGCRRAGRGAARKSKGGRRGGGAVQPETPPPPVPHPWTKAGEGGSREPEGGRTYSAVLLREEVGAVVQAFLRGRRGPARRGEDGVGETQGETLMSGRRSPRTRPAPAAPTARPGLGAADTHHHGCSEARAGAGAHRTAGRREPAAAGKRGGAGGGASEQPHPAHPARPDGAGGPRARKKEGSALRPRSKHPRPRGP